MSEVDNDLKQEIKRLTKVLTDYYDKTADGPEEEYELSDTLSEALEHSISINRVLISYVSLLEKRLEVTHGTDSD